MLDRLDKLKRQQDGKLPTDGDLETAAKALAPAVPPRPDRLRDAFASASASGVNLSLLSCAT